MTEWFHETLYPSVRQSLRIDKMLFQGNSKYQDILIFENEFLGRVLVLDGIIQTTEADEFYYHEMLSHVSIVGHGLAKSVLIIGGGDGGMLEEVLKHSVQTVTIVDIDAEVVEICRKYFPMVCGNAFEDSRTELIIGDGKEFVDSTSKTFDIIIVDSTDPVGPGELLFEEPFYHSCKRLLNHGGIMVSQNGVPFFQGKEVSKTDKNFSQLFKYNGFFISAIPTYAGGHMAFGWASSEVNLSAVRLEVIQARLDAAPIDTQYYNAQVHVGSFGLPNCIKDLSFSKQL